MSKASKQRRVVSIWLPHLAIERWTKVSGAPAEARVALIEEGPHGQLLSAATAAARAAGARPGMRLTDARALDPELAAVAADDAGDRALLDRLARWASRWSPLVEVDGADGLRLDVSGVAHLFGGEAALVRDIEARFAGLGLTARVGGGGDRRGSVGIGAVWRFAGAATGWRTSPPCPSQRLRLPADVVRTLERLGLKTIGALVGVPRRSLARRFREADNPLDALDRMLGRTPEPLTAAPIDPPPRALLRLGRAGRRPERGGARRWCCWCPIWCASWRRGGWARGGWCWPDIGSMARCRWRRRPARSRPAIRRILSACSRTRPTRWIRVSGSTPSRWRRAGRKPLDSAQDGLVGGPPPALEVARLVDRLSVKLGPDKVRRPVARASHLPERASGWGAGVGESADVLPHPFAASRLFPSPEGEGRPQRLLDSPEAIGVIYATPEGLPRRFVWRRMVHDVVRAEGPERISPEWWRERGKARLRDYYRVEDREGRRYWIYREGLFGDGRGGEPQWYLHGLFG